MTEKERMTASIGIRVCPSWKKWMMDEAIKRGQSFSEFVWNLIKLGEAEYRVRTETKK